MASGRALHFVFKIGNRSDTAKFYRDVLGMKFLRHEEFEGGCKASCNGPYDGKWSKSMVGYGPEDSHFVVELTYNYGIGKYRMGNDFRGITIKSAEAVSRAKKNNWPVSEEQGLSVLKSPDGHKFYIIPGPAYADPIQKVSLSVSNLSKSVDYWSRLLGMKVEHQDNTTALLAFKPNQCKLELVEIKEPVDHAAGFGRIAFSCPRQQLPEIEKLMKASGQKILTPLVSLDTPGKATVEVVILADPDGHEICFVGDEAYTELSQVDEHAEQLLDRALNDDKSDEWFAKKGLIKGEQVK